MAKAPRISNPNARASNLYSALMDLWHFADYHQPEKFDDADHRRISKKTLVEGRKAAELARDLVATLDDLVADLEESHRAEIESRHYGDGPACSYCDHLKEAKRLLKRAGLIHEPHWPLGDRDNLAGRPEEGRIDG
jgi:hypothetical protein